MKIAHLSDPHFGTVLPDVTEALLLAMEDIKPDLILISGDITQRARRNQFIEASTFCQRLNSAKKMAVPGNHDIPLFNIFARLFAPYSGYRKHFRFPLEEVHQEGDIRVTALNSTNRYRHIQGNLNLERIRLRLNPPGTKIHIVAFHHPVDCLRPPDEENLLLNREQALVQFAEAKVDMILGGHIHDPFVSLSKNRYPGACRNMIISGAGTCLSWRIRADAPNSFNLIEVDSKDTPYISVTRYDRGHAAFAVENQTRFVRNGSEGWEKAL